MAPLAHLGSDLFWDCITDDAYTITDRVEPASDGSLRGSNLPVLIGELRRPALDSARPVGDSLPDRVESAAHWSATEPLDVCPSVGLVLRWLRHDGTVGHPVASRLGSESFGEWPASTLPASRSCFAHRSTGVCAHRDDRRERHEGMHGGRSLFVDQGQDG